jgi:hypothetical protein
VNPNQTSALYFDVRGSPSGTWTIDQGIGNVTGLTQVTTGQLSQSRTYMLSATNPAGTVTATATAQVNILIALTPASPATLLPEQTVQFVAAVTGNPNASVTWTLQEGAVAGTLDSTGLYTAGWTSGTYHVVATSVADPTYSSAVAVTVSRPPPGTLDVTFGDGGLLIGPPGLEGGAMVVDHDNIYLASTSYDGGVGFLTMEKLLPNGARDATFPVVLGQQAQAKRMALLDSNSSDFVIGGAVGSTIVLERRLAGAPSTIGAPSSRIASGVDNYCLSGFLGKLVVGGQSNSSVPAFEVGTTATFPASSVNASQGAFAVGCVLFSGVGFAALGGSGSGLASLETSSAISQKTSFGNHTMTRVEGIRAVQHEFPFLNDAWIFGSSGGAPCIEHYTVSTVLGSVPTYAAGMCLSGAPGQVWGVDAVAGSSNLTVLLSGTPSTVVARVSTGFSLDTSFGAGGYSSVSFTNTVYGLSIAQQLNGKLVVLGNEGVGQASTRILLRLWP